MFHCWRNFCVALVFATGTLNAAEWPGASAQIRGSYTWSENSAYDMGFLGTLVLDASYNSETKVFTVDQIQGADFNYTWQGPDDLLEVAGWSDAPAGLSTGRIVLKNPLGSVVNTWNVYTATSGDVLPTGSATATSVAGEGSIALDMTTYETGTYTVAYRNHYDLPGYAPIFGDGTLFNISHTSSEVATTKLIDLRIILANWRDAGGTCVINMIYNGVTDDGELTVGQGGGADEPPKVATYNLRIQGKSTDEIWFSVPSGWTFTVDQKRSQNSWAVAVYLNRPTGSSVSTAVTQLTAGGSIRFTTTTSGGTVYTQSSTPVVQSNNNTNPIGAVGSSTGGVVSTPTSISTGAGALNTATGVASQILSQGTLDGIENNTRETADLLKPVNELSLAALQGHKDGQSAIDGMQSTATAASAEATGILPSAPTGLGYEVGGSEPDLTIEMPAMFGGLTFDMNPFQSGRFGPLASWLRAAIHWLTLVTLGVWISAQVGEWAKAINQAQQAKGNAVALGSGGQVTALIAAGIITAAVISAMVALISWGFGGVNYSAIIGLLGTNPMTTLAAGSLWMVDQVIPIATVLLALVARVAFSMYATTIYAGIAAFVRFIVP